jgi:hypothetical protein
VIVRRTEPGVYEAVQRIFSVSQLAPASPPLSARFGLRPTLVSTLPSVAFSTLRPSGSACQHACFAGFQLFVVRLGSGYNRLCYGENF